MRASKNESIRQQVPAEPNPVIEEEMLPPRQELVARAAYYRAQRRGFQPGCELQDWLEAEIEVDQMLTRPLGSRPQAGAG